MPYVTGQDGRVFEFDWSESAGTPVSIDTGDGVVLPTPGTVSSNSYTYSGPGTYQATLTTTLGGQSFTDTKTVTVLSSPSQGQALQISSGGTQGCAVDSDARVRCWGSGNFGYVGPNSQSSIPVYVADPDGATSVAVGSGHQCALKAAGSVYCMGSNLVGQAGQAPFSTVTAGPVDGLVDAVQIDASRDTTCATRSAGVAVCWGRNFGGQLGDGTTTNSSVPVQVQGLTGVTEVRTGGSGHSCALLSTGTVSCWGDNSWGQLGNGTFDSSLTPVPVTGLSGVIQITAGWSHSCATLSDESVKCWGLNNVGQLGNDSVADSSVPVPAALTGVTSVSAGRLQTCATTASGAYCWGWNSAGELGDGTTIDRHVPTLVAGALPVQISTGNQSTCAVDATGLATCWGSNDNGKLGDGTTTPSPIPVPVSGFESATDQVTAVVSSSLVSGRGPLDVDFDGTSSSSTGGAIVGYDWDFGDGSTSTEPSPSHTYWQDGTYTAVLTVTDEGGGSATDSEEITVTDSPSRVAAGDRHSCVVIEVGDARCWGNNSSGQLGTGTAGGASLAAVDANVLGDIAQVSAGAGYTCALVTDGTVHCWGKNEWGTLGDGTTTDSASPVEVPGMTDIRRISSSARRSCAVDRTGAVYCWGLTSTQVAGLTDVVDLSVGLSHSCAAIEDGTVWCWGSGGYGELGDGLEQDSLTTPVQVTGISSARSVSAGRLVSCAVLDSGAARCWGHNSWGQLGNGTTVSSPVPVAVAGLTDATSITAGQRGACAVLSSGSVRCWGSGSVGTLDPVPVLSPVVVGGVTDADHVSATPYDDWHNQPGGEPTYLGPTHRCASTSLGVQCWGPGGFGALGDGTGSSSSTPVTVIGL